MGLWVVFFANTVQLSFQQDLERNPIRKWIYVGEQQQQFWAKGISYLKSMTAVSQVHCSNTKSKCYVFFSQKLTYIGNLYHKVSPLDSKGKLSEHKECAYCNKRSLKVSTKINAITTVLFSPMHKLASAQFKVKITSHGVMQQQGGLLLAPEGSLLAKAMKKWWHQDVTSRERFAKFGSESLTCQSCINLQTVWKLEHMETGSTFHGAS